MSRKKAPTRRVRPAQPQAAQAPAAHQAAPPASDLLRMEEAIAVLKTTRPTFYRWLRENKIKAYKVGRQWRFLKEDLESFLKGRQPRIDLPVSPEPLLAEVRRQLRDLGQGDTTERFRDGSDPLAEAACLIIRLAAAQRASDIHLAPHYDGKEHSALLRHRIDGVLCPVAQIDPRLLSALIERFKTLGGMNPSETKLPQDGRILIQDRGGRDVDLRLCILPATRGESLTGRLLVPAELNFDIEGFGYSPQDKKKIVESAGLSHGLVIAAGPTGCGKTTTLYSLVSMAAGPEVKTMTVEDPVEYLLPWMVQVGVNEQAGLTFARCIRAVLRSDPDVVLVGEIRNPEVANLCVQVALTGHLVYGTLHCYSAAQTLQRLVEMNVPAFVVADAVRLVIAQKLIRKLCSECARPATLSREEESQAAELAVRGGIPLGDLGALRDQGGGYRQPVGCKECGGIGYRGRTVIAETLRMGPEVGRCLRAGAPQEDIRRAAIQEGMTTIEADGIRKAAAGLTTLDEVRRVLSLGAVS